MAATIDWHLSLGDEPEVRVGQLEEAMKVVLINGDERVLITGRRAELLLMFRDICPEITAHPPVPSDPSTEADYDAADERYEQRVTVVPHRFASTHPFASRADEDEAAGLHQHHNVEGQT